MRFGTLTAALPGRAAIQYTFTPADVVWIARFIATTAQGADRERRRYLTWTLFDRFASHAARRRDSFGSRWREGLSFRDFLGQYFPSVARTQWNELPPDARGLAVAATMGRLGASTTSSGVTVEPSTSWQSAGYGGYSPWNGEAEQFEGDPTAGNDPSATPTSPQQGDANASAAPTAPAVTPTPDVAPVVVAPAVAAAPVPDFSSAPPIPDDVPDDPGAYDPQDDPSAFTTMDGRRLMWRPRFWRHHHHYNGQPWQYTSMQYPPSYYRSPYQYGSVYSQPGYRVPYATSYPVAYRSTSTVSPYRQHAAIASRLAQLAQRSRYIGSLRNRYSGTHYPVFGGRVGAKNYRFVTRQHGGKHYEIMSLHSHELEQELAN